MSLSCAKEETGGWLAWADLSEHVFLQFVFYHTVGMCRFVFMIARQDPNMKMVFGE